MTVCMYSIFSDKCGKDPISAVGRNDKAQALLGFGLLGYHLRQTTQVVNATK